MSETIREYYYWLKVDLEKAIVSKNENQLQLELIRIQRLLAKLENQVTTSMLKREYITAAESLELRSEIHSQLGKWYAAFAEEQDMDGNWDLSASYWLNAIALNGSPDYLLAFARFLFKQTGLQPCRKMEENMEYVTPNTIHELIPKLKMIRICIQDAVKKQGHFEETRLMLTFLDLIEKEIADTPALQVTMNQDEEAITVDAALSELNKLIGMSSVKEKVTEISNWIRFSKMRHENGLKTEAISYHMVFSGNPGTGKTTIARIIAKIYKSLGVLKKGHLVEVGRSDLVAEYVGQTAVKTMKKIKEAENGVLFVDEAYALTRSGSNDFGIEAIDTLVKAMEDKRDKLVVILAGYPNEMEHFIKSNPGLYSRFKYHIQFPDYTPKELLEILQIMCIDKQYRMDEEAKKIADRLIKRVIIRKPTEHGNGRLVRNLLEDAILKKASYTIGTLEHQDEKIPLDLITADIMRLVELERQRS